ncbi:MAG: hypothetical protein FWF10_05610 [Clostridiales bacterium]|nr:hypothetical protein [Clostridiales bacterium]
MRKTLSDLAAHVKSVIIPETDETYAIDPVFAELADEESVREGVSAYRTFLHRFCDTLITNGDLYDIKTKIPHAYENRSGTSVYYPFLKNIKDLLLNIGIQSVSKEDALVFGGEVINPKLPVSKSVACLRFLTDCGIAFGGVDLDGKKPDLSNIERMTASYPDHPAMLMGLKTMAMAEKRFGTLTNWDIFLRCDYRALGNGQTDAFSTLENTIAPLSAGMRNLILRLHRHGIAKGLNCEAEIKDFWILIKYSHKRKELWGLNKSLNNGFELSVKAANTAQYADAIQAFPPILRETIAKGYGCGRKRPEIGHCDGGCRGLRLPLDESVLEIADAIETWFDLELACIQTK